MDPMIQISEVKNRDEEVKESLIVRNSGGQGRLLTMVEDVS